MGFPNRGVTMTKGTLALATLLCVGLASAQAQEQPEVFPQLGNSHGINALAFSPDGAVLASAGADSRGSSLGACECPRASYSVRPYWRHRHDLFAGWPRSRSWHFRAGDQAI